MSKQSIPESGIYDARELGVPKMLILGFQHMFAMFGATVLVPALTGLSVSATLLFAGLGTLLFWLQVLRHWNARPKAKYDRRRNNRPTFVFLPFRPQFRQHFFYGNGGTACKP